MPKPPRRNAPEARLAEADLASLEGIGPWPGREVTVDGARLFVRSTPALADGAEPALFVHGLGGSSHNWTDFAGLLRNRLASEAIDLPGHGNAGPAPRNRYSPQVFADLVISYLDQSGRGAVHLAGNSMGGAVCILVAAQRPDLVRTLTLVSPAVPDNRPRVFALKSDWRMGLLVLPVLGPVAMRRMAGVSARVRAKATIALCFADPSRYPEARLDEAVAQVEERGSMPWASGAFLRSTRGLVRSQFFHGRTAWRALREIEAPTLVLWGDRDRLVAPDLAPYVAAAVPDSRLRVFTDVGHTAMMEVPVGSARALIGLLDDSAAAEASTAPDRSADVRP